MSRQSILVLVVLCLPFCVSFVAPVHADPLSVTILSGEQRVWGSVYEYYQRWEGGVLTTIEHHDSYESGVQPWNGSSLYDEAILPENTYASSYVDALNVEVATNSEWRNWAWWETYASATAEGTWVFRANGCELPMHAAGRIWPFDPMTVKLEDLTSSTELFYYSGNAGGCFDGWAWAYEAPVFSVDPGHVYRMYIRLSSSAMMDGSFSGSLGASVTLTPIPLPGAALLGVIGLGYAGMRLRRV